MKNLLFIVGVLILVVWGISALTNGESEMEEENTMTMFPLTGDEVFAFDADASTFNWRGETVVGSAEVGTIAITEGSLTLASSTISKGSFAIDMTSLSSEVKAPEKHLKSTDFFDVEKYPTATFVITSVAHADMMTATTYDADDMDTEMDDSVANMGENGEDSAHMYDVTGDLTIKEVVHPITFPAKIYLDEEGNLHAEASFGVDRTKWGINFRSGDFFAGLGDSAIKNEFTVVIDLLAHAPMMTATTSTSDTTHSTSTEDIVKGTTQN